MLNQSIEEFPFSSFGLAHLMLPISNSFEFKCKPQLHIHDQKKTLKLNKVLIIHTDGNTYNNPTLKAVVDLLLNRGIEVQISYPKSQAPMPSVKGVTLHPISSYLLALKLFLYERPALNLLTLTLARIELTISRFLMKKI